MKNFIKVLFVAMLSSCFMSCNHEAVENKGTFYISSTFELPDEEYSTNFMDSLACVPKFYYEQVAYVASSCSALNQGYQGGFQISYRIGSIHDSDERAIFSSAGSDNGALLSKTYAAYYGSGVLPKYDYEFDFSQFKTVTNTIVGCMINNTRYTERLKVEGDLAEGDYLKVTAHFSSDGAEVGTGEKVRVDYRSGSNVFVDKWEAWDMDENMDDKTSFDAIRFEVTTSGPKLKPCFCIDNLTSYLTITY